MEEFTEVNATHRTNEACEDQVWMWKPPPVDKFKAKWDIVIKYKYLYIKYIKNGTRPERAKICNKLYCIETE